jgi:hypothetical protein
VQARQSNIPIIQKEFEVRLPPAVAEKPCEPSTEISHRVALRGIAAAPLDQVRFGDQSRICWRRPAMSTIDTQRWRRATGDAAEEPTRMRPPAL